MEQSFSFERDIAYSVRGTYNQNIKHRFFLVVFFCSPMILPLAIISNMIASSRKIVTIFQFLLELFNSWGGGGFWPRNFSLLKT